MRPAIATRSRSFTPRPLFPEAPPIVFLFPGQNSRYPGSLDKLSVLHPDNGEILAAASDILHRDLGAHYRKDNANAFARNRDIQVGVFLSNHMFLRMLQRAKIRAVCSLGLSLGEYNHLVHIGALTFQDALLTVEQRGLAYDDGPRGAMASVFPIDLEELQAVADRASTAGLLEVVNLNSPSQHVLSGERAAIAEAIRILDDEFFVETTIIERQIPMHSSLFEPVGRRFRRYLEEVPFARPRLAYLPNRLGHAIDSPSSATFVELLSSHVHKPVLWRKSIDHVVEKWPDAIFVEVGARAVLHNLINKKWRRNRKFHTDSVEDTADHLKNVIDKLHDLAPGDGD